MKKSVIGKKLKHETSTRRIKCNTEKLQPEKSATRNVTTLKKVQHANNAT